MALRAPGGRPQERGGGEKVGGCRGADERIGKQRGKPCPVVGGGLGDGDKTGDNSRVGGVASGVGLVSHSGFRPRRRSPLKRYRATYGWLSTRVGHAPTFRPGVRSVQPNPTNRGPPSLYVDRQTTLNCRSVT
jgi:hypothetical protein